MSNFPIQPRHRWVFVDIVDRDVTQKDLGNGKVLHLLSDDTFGLHDPTSGAAHPGIRPRWARVLAIGPEVDELTIGDRVLCDYGKWGRRVPLGRVGSDTFYFWWISADDVSIVDDTVQDHEAFSALLESTISQLELNVGNP